MSTADTEFREVLAQLESVVGEATASAAVSDVQLRRVLSFLTKVAHVVDQAFQDVYTLLIELKHVSVEQYESGYLDNLRKELDLILARSKYRDAEEICSRLFHLRQHFQEHIAPLLANVGQTVRWRQLFWLIEEREGRIIMLVHSAVREINELLEGADESVLPAIRKAASERAGQIRETLTELRSFSSAIMGLSGQTGFLELTADRNALSNQVRFFVNKGAFQMGDQYHAGQVGAMGPKAHAHDMTFQQIWNQSAQNIDLPSLLSDLSVLRGALRNEASEPEHEIAIGNVAAAEKAAADGNGPKALAYLKQAGNWALSVAEKIGVGVATAAIKSSMGL
jgi:hypothetical protein